MDDWKAYVEPLLEPLPLKNPLPAWEPLPHYIAKLPLHVMSVATHECVFCGEKPIFDSYEEYRKHFYEFEYEGERYHAPDSELKYHIIASLCTS
ncbi:hypothetical protein SEA_BLUERUGRAT_27 [Microbacterium phage BlueRugrat]|nr:hypothetical protein SEA_BLUERUGRAT_27 [Microbacterium phage BlueRugrat]